MPIPTDTGETSAARLRQMDESSEWVQRRKSQSTDPNSADDHNGATVRSTSQDNAEEQAASDRGAFGGTTTPPDERRPKPAYPQLVKVPVEPGQPPLELRSQIQVYATNELRYLLLKLCLLQLNLICFQATHSSTCITRTARLTGWLVSTLHSCWERRSSP
jgi:hypothetical protein